jgi:hypothetical protein
MRSKWLTIFIVLILTAVSITACGPAKDEVIQSAGEDPKVLPRRETLYFNGQQFGPVVGWNPYSTDFQ